MNEVIEIMLNPLQTAGLAVLAYLVGARLVAGIEPLRNYCIPIPVVGGILFALVIFAANQTGLFSIVLTTQPIQEFFMNIFFTTIGFGASYAALKKGGWQVMMLLVLATGVIVTQNVLGIGIAFLFDINPLYGVAAGSVSMAGGHGTSAAFGPELEAAGASGATAIAMASATIGLVAANFIGGPVASSNIEKYQLAGTETSTGKINFVLLTGAIESKKMFDSFLLIILAMGIGVYVGYAIVWLTPLDNLPSYIGALIAGAIIRNIAEATDNIKIHSSEVRCIGEIGISIFLSLAMLSLDLVQITKLAGPVLTAVLVILAAHTVLTIITTKYIVFRALGKDYEAGVLCGGFAGLQMGATPNAVAIMGAVTAKYGEAPHAFLILPIASGFFIDFINAICITLILSI